MSDRRKVMRQRPPGLGEVARGARLVVRPPLRARERDGDQDAGAQKEHRDLPELARRLRTGLFHGHGVPHPPGAAQAGARPSHETISPLVVANLRETVKPE